MGIPCCRLRHCEERHADEAIHGAAYASDGLLRCARNNGWDRSNACLPLYSATSAFEMFDCVDKVFLEFLHHRAGGFDAVDQADALADEIADEVARPGVAGGGGAIDRIERVAADDALQRHRQRAGAVRPTIPGVGPDRAQLPRRLAGAAFGTDGVARGGRDHLFAEDFGGLGFDGGEPHRTGPDAGRAHRHAGRHLPPGHDTAGGQHRHVADRLDRLDHFRHQHHGRDLAAMAAGLGALYHEDIDAGRDLAQRVLLGADQGRNRHAVFPAHLDHGPGRYAESIGNQADRMAERSIEHLQRALAVERLRLIVIDVGCGQLDAVFLQQVAGEIAMLGRNPRFETFPGDVFLACGRNVLRDQHVEAIGLAVDMVVDPFQFLLDRFRGMRGGAEHAETSGAADGRDHVAAMAEGQQRKLDAQHVADRRFHDCVHSLPQPADPARPFEWRRPQRRYRIRGSRAKPVSLR